MWRMEATQLGAFVAALGRDGYEVMGPQRREGAIVYEPLSSAEALPQGWTDTQEAGRYRLARRDDDAYFGYNVGPASWKRELLPARRRLWQATQTDEGLRFVPEPIVPRKLALLGVRPCELAAMAIQDTILKEGEHADPHYQAQRDALLLIVVQCAEAGGTCFCHSMDTGPRADGGFDLALTELITPSTDDGPSEHYFLVECGSPRGEAFLDGAGLALAAARQEEHEAALAQSAHVATQMGRSMETDGLPGLVRDAFSSAHWKEVGDRCLSCANCTMVCPTCFCTSVEDVSDVSGEHAERWRRWDSCFHQDFSYIAGGSVRSSVASRYRQWMTHKLGYWVEQFGTSGCVGCGRCVTWCPVGIDITEEAASLRAQTAGEDDGST